MTITNIQFRVNHNNQGAISGDNIIYDRKNPDGTCDRIERVLEVFHEGRWSPYGSHVNTSIVVTAANGPTSSIVTLGDLNACINYYEKGGTGNFVHNRFLFLGPWSGKITRIERLPPPMEEQVKDLTAQVRELTKQLANVTLANNTLSRTNQQKDNEILKIGQDLARFNQLLENLK